MATMKKRGDVEPEVPVCTMDVMVRALVWVQGRQESAVFTRERAKIDLANRHGVPPEGSEFSVEIVARLLPCPDYIVNESTARSFLAHIMVTRRLALGFSPDTLFEDYVDREGARVFSDEEASRYNHLVNSIYIKLGEVAMYELSVSLVEAIWPDVA